MGDGGQRADAQSIKTAQAGVGSRGAAGQQSPEFALSSFS